VAHGVHLAPDAIADLIDGGAFIATNPRSNMNNAVGLSSARGARIALGTDGIGADMIAEAQAHFLRHAEALDGLAGSTLERLVGAQRLASFLSEEEERTPRIAVGERADLAVLRYRSNTPWTPENLAGHVLFAWSSALVRDTIVDGRFVLRNREVVNIDEKELAERATNAAIKLWSRMEKV
jgi:cytosine/adenosine deaminase-related metal-dependent hydrolase